LPALPLQDRTQRRGRSLADELGRRLEEEIRAQRWRPGERLPTEAEIVQAYGVSRSVVREAVSKLQAGGVVETRHGVGTFVLAPRPATQPFGINPGEIEAALDVMAMLELRISVETEAAGLAAQRHTDEQMADIHAAAKALHDATAEGRHDVDADLRLHLAIARATGNRYFVDILGHLGRTMFPRSRVDSPRIAMEDPQAYSQRVQREHEEIVSAIARREAEAARAAMRMHLVNSRERVRRAQEATSVI
jgi:GntR family transcriptional repressor for pyruvate dehydrogenase complex